MVHVDSILHAFKTERARQELVEGFNPDHDDDLHDGELALAAAVYATNHCSDERPRGIDWPWPLDEEPHGMKMKDPVANLVRAGALIMAELERLMRMFDKRLGGVHLRRCSHCGWYEVDATALACSHCGEGMTSA